MYCTVTFIAHNTHTTVQITLDCLKNSVDTFYPGTMRAELCKVHMESKHGVTFSSFEAIKNILVSIIYYKRLF